MAPVPATSPKSPAPEPTKKPRPLSNGFTDVASSRSYWTPEKEKILLSPYDYLLAHPGKDIRAQLVAAFNQWLQVPPSTLQTIVSVITKLHTASLLIDDVEDNSELRRGVPVAHSIFGVAQTINTANYVYFLALSEAAKLPQPGLQIYTEELLNLHRGQGMELFWRDSLQCPSEEDYLEMVSNKTGGLFRLAIKLMSCASEFKPDLLELVNYIGMIFQIRDDYINLNSTQYQANKGFCEDLTEGKFSFPIIHAVRKDEGDRQLLNILKQRTESIEVKRYAVEYMRKSGSFEHTREVLRGMDREARRCVEGLGGNELITAILDMLKVEEPGEKEE